MRVLSSDSRECAANWSGVNGDGTLVILNRSSFAGYLLEWLLAFSAQLTRRSVIWRESYGLDDDRQAKGDPLLDT
jgi:hypothetical protein